MNKLTQLSQLPQLKCKLCSLSLKQITEYVKESRCKEYPYECYRAWNKMGFGFNIPSSRFQKKPSDCLINQLNFNGDPYYYHDCSGDSERHRFVRLIEN